MSNANYGLQVNNADGSNLLDLGAHVIKKEVEFSQIIGAIAASWSQAENNILCLLSVILDISLDEAEQTAKKYNSAEKMIKALRNKSSSMLSGQELNFLNHAINELDEIRSQRNRIQHDVWAKKGSDNSRLYVVHVKEYLAFYVEFSAAIDLYKQDSKAISQCIDIATDFSNSITKSFSIQDLNEILEKIDKASMAIMKSMFKIMSSKQLNKFLSTPVLEA